MTSHKTFDAVVIGGGPAGATAATRLADAGYSVALLDKAGRIKPCGGAIPPRLIEDYDIPDEMLVAKINTARIVSPANRSVDMTIDGGFVGMVDREEFDEWLRARAAKHGVTRLTGRFERLEALGDGLTTIHFKAKSREGSDASRPHETVVARMIIGADGARSEVARQAIPNYRPPPCVFAYHEIIETPATRAGDTFDGSRCDVVYNGTYSPDFYAWVFPHGRTTSVGVGSAEKGFSLRQATAGVREASDLTGARTIRKEGAPIPLKPLKRWDNGANAILAGDAAGVVAPASGEGIYYAMLSGQYAGEAVGECLRTGDARALATARRRFMREHGRIFWILGVMQHFWYRNDKRRESFVKICQDRDVQRLTWQSYMYKRVERASPVTHARIFFKDLAHLVGLRQA
jgi:geranylgeranyl reductase